uniref:Lysozyme n=1 Tax=Bacteriophage sp. TaxID=38018 RepID=A0A7G8LRJ1_9VIRU|nr:MAG: lysozime [Bacteriophage sp.]
MTNMLPITLGDLFRYYHGTPHQMAAIAELEAEMMANGAAAVLSRDQPWFKTWSQDGKQHDTAPALKLIKEFEGCHLEAYTDPLHGGDLWTIGYGSTRYGDGRKVKQGDKINLIEADMLLRLEVDRIAAKLRSTVPHWNEMTDDQQSALISFAYNLGAGFYGTAGFETISNRLRDRKWDEVPEALLLYRNPGTNVEAGLKRRRIAEGKLWVKGLPEIQQDTAKLRPGSPFTARITPHIQLGEFALWQEARRFDHQYQVDTAAELAAFLERARAQFGGKPVVITSGYRPPAINASVGGASGSEHLYAPGVGAVDFYIRGVNINHVQDWCDASWPYSLGYGAPKGFVHLGIRSGRPRVRWDY